MKESESSFDVMASVRDLQGLVGGYVDKIYHPTLDHLILSVRTPGEGKTFIHFRVGRWLYVSETGQEGGKQPSDFAMMLRKRLTNAKITAIRQQGFDRIAVVTLEKEGTWELVLELFAEGNIVLVKDGVIVQPLTSHTWKHRDVRAKRDFLFPPPVPDPSSITAEDLYRFLTTSDTDLVRTLATRLNTGGRYSEEICARAAVDKRRKANELTVDDVRAILDVVKSIQSEILSQGEGLIIQKDSVIEDIVPFKMRIYDNLQTEQFTTFSEAVQNYITRLPKPKKEKPKASVLESERLDRKLLQQESAVTKLQDEAREYQLMGDFLFENYPAISSILSLAKKKMAESIPLDGIEGFVSYEGKSSVLKVKVKDVLVKLDAKGSVESNAQLYYKESKKARKKLEGLLVALVETRKSIGDFAKGQRSLTDSSRPKHAGTKRFWFERFRWFISSEGAIVLGGKDAKSNDMLVKKHLQAGDRYVHADIHGAPSVVVKMKEGVTEKTLHEACEFAVATSKAWNAKVGSGVGYWVLPEQVSKTPESGEYLAKGAFVIRGKRNYSEKLEIKLGIGETEFEDHRKIMCGPEGALRAHSTKFAVIGPGRIDKDAFAKSMAGLFEVPIEEIQSILPPGDVKIIEQVGLVIP
jgi:predicted ribosome quality control (RQC) complex YloA/Tae2 family protein